MSVRNLLSEKYIVGTGIEIGALHNPLPVNHQQAAVLYVDRWDRAGLLKRFPELKDSADSIVSASIFLDANQELTKLAGAEYDFLIANHLIEHFANPIQFLVDTQLVLREGGVLYLAVPDKRYTFDINRKLTSFQHLWQDFINGVHEVSEDHLLDFILNTPTDATERARIRRMYFDDNMNPLDPPELRRLFGLHRERSIHVHVWNEESFIAFLRRAIRKVPLPYRIIDMARATTKSGEVIIILKRIKTSAPYRLQVITQRYNGEAEYRNRRLKIGKAVAKRNRWFRLCRPSWPAESKFGQLQKAKVIQEAEMRQLQHHMKKILHSRSWKLTTLLRQLRSALHIGHEQPKTTRRRWGLQLDGLRGLWYRMAYHALSFSSLPSTIEASPQDLQEPIRWIPSVRIRNQVKQALFMHPPSRVTYRFTAPSRAVFQAFVALLPEAWGQNPGGVEFNVSVSPRNGGCLVSRKRWSHPTHFPRHRQWMKFRVSLHRFANREVELSVSTSVPSKASADFAWAAWGDPVILSRKGLRDIWALSIGYLKVYGVRGILGKTIGAVKHLDEFGNSPAGERSLESFNVPVPAKEQALQPQMQALQAYSLLEQMLRVKLKLFLSQYSNKLVLPQFKKPLVSIVIPTFNKAEYLYQHLESIRAYTDVPFELIIVDDCSEDETSRFLKSLENVQVIRNEENLEFIRSCNKGARLAKGRYILFLNDDVMVTPQWLSTLVTTIEEYPKCGAVGAKLVRPDGTLQEAGSIVWKDGTASAYGRDDDPFKPEYCYLREVDYCSAACLLVRADLFRTLQGFDERYLPAYYEDSDLCLGLRQLGYKVVYQPKVTVVHYEFGSRSYERAKALMKASHPKFTKKWAGVLSQQSASYGNVLRARDKREGKRVLVMDDLVPAPYLGCGYPRAHMMLKCLAELGFIVTFVPLIDRTPYQPVTHQLQRLGIEVFYGNGFTPQKLLQSRSGYYDIIIISRPHNGAKYLGLARQYCPSAQIIYDAEALFCMREFLKAQLEGRSLSETERKKMLRKELAIMTRADVVIMVSESEREVILREGAHHNVVVWGYAHDLHMPITPFSKRRDLLFVGGFPDEHAPNSDAVLHFANKLFPKIQQKLLDCRFIVVGSNPPEPIRKLASEAIVFTGFVEGLHEYYEKCRIFVVPTRFAAGISLKTIEAMSYGIPAVVSTIAASGLGLHDGQEALIASNDDEFIEKVIQLYEDETRWSMIQQAAQDYVQQRFSLEKMKTKLGEILGSGRGTESKKTT